jgi:hypothetical protein
MIVWAQFTYAPLRKALKLLGFVKCHWSEFKSQRLFILLYDAFVR